LYILLFYTVIYNMTEYHMHGLSLTENQVNKIINAAQKRTSVAIRLTNANLHGNVTLPLTQTQINRINKAKAGMILNLSFSQIKHIDTMVSKLQNEHKRKIGGFLPLLSLIPLIVGALGAAGGVAGGVASAVSAANNAKAAVAAQAETERHNREVEAQLKTGGPTLSTGSGVVSDFVGKTPLIGSFLKPLLEKLGLGVGDYNKIINGGCVCLKQFGKGLYLKPYGGGLFIGPQGSGLYLGPPGT
jgi:hypothetical protein